MLFAVRGSEGIGVYDFDGSNCQRKVFKQRQDRNAYCRVLKFSKDGKLLAYCDGHRLCVYSTANLEDELWSAELPRTYDLEWSGCCTWLCSFEPFQIRAGEEAEPNVRIFEAATGEIVMQYIERRNNWKPRWTNDGKIMSKVSGSEIHFYETPNFDRYLKKLVIKGFTAYEVSSGSDPHTVAVYVPGIKNGPCFVRLFRYPAFHGPEAAICHASFFRADRALLKFNPKGDACLCLTASDVDSTGASYYGEQTLYLLLATTESLRMDLPKEGPIYACEFSPVRNEFCVVYGYMPAKATIYNLKGDPVFDFGTGPRNEIHYNSFGDLVVLAGFGNLRGNVEFWSAKDWKLVQKVTAEDTTVFSWAPDGRHLLTATTAPRLRVGNGVRIWHYTGKVAFRDEQPEGVEVLDGCWCPADVSGFKQVPLQTIPPAQQGVSIGTGSGTETKVPALAAYVPPHLRGTGRSAGPIRSLEPAQNAKAAAAGEELSKTALKNKKKREAKKAKAAGGDTGDGRTASPQSQSSGPTPAPVAATQRLPSSSGLDEKERKIRNLTKKLEAIELLKKQQKEGKQLELNQLEKLKKEQELRDDLNDLLD